MENQNALDPNADKIDKLCQKDISLHQEKEGQDEDEIQEDEDKDEQKEQKMGHTFDDWLENISEKKKEMMDEKNTFGKTMEVSKQYE